MMVSMLAPRGSLRRCTSSASERAATPTPISSRRMRLAKALLSASVPQRRDRISIFSGVVKRMLHSARRRCVSTVKPLSERIP